jgi:hypothetical protein
MKTLNRWWTLWRRGRRLDKLARANLTSAQSLAWPAVLRAAQTYGVIVVPATRPDRFTFIGSRHVVLDAHVASNRPGAIVFAASSAR